MARNVRLATTHLGTRPLATVLLMSIKPSVSFHDEVFFGFHTAVKWVRSQTALGGKYHHL